MRLTDKVAIVTGSGSGMGRAIATRLAEEGANVIVADINESGMNETVQALTEKSAMVSAATLFKVAMLAITMGHSDWPKNW